MLPWCKKALHSEEPDLVRINVSCWVLSFFQVLYISLQMDVTQDLTYTTSRYIYCKQLMILFSTNAAY